jgi:hypothetical protein
MILCVDPNAHLAGQCVIPSGDHRCEALHGHASSDASNVAAPGCGRSTPPDCSCGALPIEGAVAVGGLRAVVDGASRRAPGLSIGSACPARTLGGGGVSTEDLCPVPRVLAEHLRTVVLLI